MLIQRRCLILGGDHLIFPKSQPDMVDLRGHIFEARFYFKDLWCSIFLFVPSFVVLCIVQSIIFVTEVLGPNWWT